MKDPKCPICGGKHYKFQCWRNPKTTPKAKYALERNISPKLATLPKNTIRNPKKTQNTRKRLVNALDKAFSEYIRRRYANDKGLVYCYTCGKQDHWKNMDCGHFMKRGYFPTRWDELNCRCQCQFCLTGEATLYSWDFSKVKQRDVKAGDVILARNPMSDGMMLVEVEWVEPVHVDKVECLRVDGETIRASHGHLIETRNGFCPIEKVVDSDIIRLWKK